VACEEGTRERAQAIGFKVVKLLGLGEHGTWAGSQYDVQVLAGMSLWSSSCA
jgi:hypothetical protein